MGYSWHNLTRISGNGTKTIISVHSARPVYVFLLLPWSVLYALWNNGVKLTKFWSPVDDHFTRRIIVDAPDVTAATLVERTVAKVSWESDFIIMQNLSEILLLFWPRNITVSSSFIPIIFVFLSSFLNHASIFLRQLLLVHLNSERLETMLFQVMWIFECMPLLRLCVSTIAARRLLFFGDRSLVRKITHEAGINTVKQCI